MSTEIEERKKEPMGWRWVIVVGGAIVTLFPIFWIILTSVKPFGEWITTPVIWIPSRFAFENYSGLFTGEALQWTGLSTKETAFLSIYRGHPIYLAFIDSSICAGLGTTLSIIVGTLAALGISRHRMGGDFFPIFLISARMMPPIVAVIPLLILYSTLHLVDTYLGLILAYALFTSPYSTWIIKSFIDEIPRELEESAMIDGVSTLGAYRKVTLPLIKGGILATALFVLILNWSEFLFALTLSHHKNVLTLPIQIKYMFSYAGNLYGPQSALGVLAVIPLITFGILIQKYLVRGLTFGAIKR